MSMLDRSVKVAVFNQRPVEDVVTTVVAECERVGFDTSEIADLINAPGDHDTIRVPYDDWSVSLQMNVNPDRPADEPAVLVGLDDLVDPSEADDGETYGARMDVAFELVCSLAMALEADYAAMFSLSGRSIAVLPDGANYVESVDRPPRFGIFSDGVLQDFGGLDELFDDDPWYVAELVDGRTVVIETAWPWSDGGWRPPANADFLQDAALTEADADSDDVDLGDPFAALAPGEYGADLVIPQDRLDGEFRNEDAELVRVYVDENRGLRRVEDDSFVRNVVTDTSGPDPEVIDRMAADLPPGTDPEDVPLSVLVNDQIPPSFVRLDEPDGENVVTLVMGLNVHMSKYDVLMALANRARPDDGYTDDELESIEGGLSTLVDVDDPLRVETWLRENVF